MKKLDTKDKKIQELKNTIDSVRRTLAYRDSEIDQLKGELKGVKDKWNEYRQHIEGRELPAIAENQWLRETLRMIMVSADKWDALLKKDPLNYRNTL